MLLGGILLDPTRSFNFDETGIVLSAGYSRVLGIKGLKHCFEEKKAREKQNITVLSTVGADGSLPPPMIIYPRKRISYEMSNVSGGFEFVVGNSEKGWITFETLYEYFVNYFSKWLTENNIQRPVIVWNDWHETRCNFFLAKRLTELGIIMIGLWTCQFLVR